MTIRVRPPLMALAVLAVVAACGSDSASKTTSDGSTSSRVSVTTTAIQSTSLTSRPLNTRTTETTAVKRTTTSTAREPATTTTSAADPDGFASLSIAVTTDLEMYQPGEPVTITVTSCNTGDATYSQSYTAPLYETKVVDHAGNVVADEQPRGAYPQVVQTITWSPRECKRDEIKWEQNTGSLRADGSDRRTKGERAAPGRYRASVRWRGYEDSPRHPTIASPEFELV